MWSKSFLKTCENYITLKCNSLYIKAKKFNVIVSFVKKT